MVFTNYIFTPQVYGCKCVKQKVRSYSIATETLIITIHRCNTLSTLHNSELFNYLKYANKIKQSSDNENSNKKKRIPQNFDFNGINQSNKFKSINYSQTQFVLRQSQKQFKIYSYSKYPSITCMTTVFISLLEGPNKVVLVYEWDIPVQADKTFFSLKQNLTSC